MAEHTPTPWISDSEGILPTGRDDVAVIARVPNHPENSKNWEANAAFIVKAVNNHDALVEALTEARLQLEYIHEKHGYATTEATLARIRYVLSPLSQESPDV